MSTSASAGCQRPHDEWQTKFEEYARGRDPGLRAELTEAFLPLAATVAGRFSTASDSREDLEQAARVALVTAIDRYDPSRGFAFSTFAWATIAGELKRHRRERTWGMRVPRRVQEHFLVTARAADDLYQEQGRPPTLEEISARTGLHNEATIEALEVRSAHRLRSLDAPDPAGGPGSWDRSTADEAFERADESDLLRRLLARLNDEERELLRLRFCEQLTQSAIAVRIGISQMHVSRRLASLLERMRALAIDQPPLRT